MGRGMAKKKYSTRKRKLQPAVMQFSLLVPAGESYVDLALCASITNRRGYKQQNSNWAVSQFEVFQEAAGGTGLLRIDKLPETWVFDNAYTKSKALWDEMNDQVLDVEEGIQGRYADFKIHMDSDMVSQTIQCAANPTGRILTPAQVVGASTVFTSGDFVGGAPQSDWSWSQITVPNDPASGVTTQYYLHAVGADIANSKGMIHGYAVSRSRPQNPDPNVPTAQGWMNDLFDVGEQLDELRNTIESDNDSPPFPLASSGSNEFYPGGINEQTGLQTHSFCNFTGTTVSGKNTIMGGVFQRGLLKFNNTTDAALSVIIHMLPGTHRGYMCEVDA